MFHLCLSLWKKRLKTELRFPFRTCEKSEYFISSSRIFEKQPNSLTFYFEPDPAGQESTRKENYNAKKSLATNQQGSCGDRYFSVAVCRGTGKWKSMGECLCFRRTLWIHPVLPTFFSRFPFKQWDSSHKNCIAKNREGKNSTYEYW